VALQPRTDSQTTTSADVPGSEASLLAATPTAKPARPISEQEALGLLQPPQSSGDHGENPEEILEKILGAYGTERQVLIAEYLLAVSKLPRRQQAVAQKRLVALFEPRR
jgi:hypothetical protein